MWLNCGSELLHLTNVGWLPKKFGAKKDAQQINPDNRGDLTCPSLPQKQHILTSA